MWIRHEHAASVARAEQNNVDAEFMLAVCLLNQWYFAGIDKIKMV